MRFPRSAVVFILFLLSMTPAVSQREPKEESRKFDSFGDDDYESIRSRLDAFSIELSKEQRARGVIIVYRARRDLPGVNSRYATRAKNYLVKRREHSAEQIITIDGGRADCLKTELWVVPAGAEPPSAAPLYIYEPRNRNFLRKFDEHPYFKSQEYIEGGWSVDTEDEAAHLDGFAAALKNEPRAFGYIIAYGQSYEDQGMIDTTEPDDADERFDTELLQDSANTVRKILETEKHYLVRKYGIAPSRVKTINGGFREARVVELWIAPPDTPAPNPVPTTYFKRRKMG